MANNGAKWLLGDLGMLWNFKVGFAHDHGMCGNRFLTTWIFKAFASRFNWQTCSSVIKAESSNLNLKFVHENASMIIRSAWITKRSRRARNIDKLIFPFYVKEIRPISPPVCSLYRHSVAVAGRLYDPWLIVKDGASAARSESSVIIEYLKRWSLRVPSTYVHAVNIPFNVYQSTFTPCTREYV